MLFQCWPSVFDAGPALKQYWVNVPCLLGFCALWQYRDRRRQYHDRRRQYRDRRRQYHDRRRQYRDRRRQYRDRRRQYHDRRRQYRDRRKRDAGTTLFCETRWRHSVKTRLYKIPLPHTSFCETQWRHSVKTRLYKNPPPYFIVLVSSVKTKEVEVIEFHRITNYAGPPYAALANIKTALAQRLVRVHWLVNQPAQVGGGGSCTILTLIE